MKFELVLKGNVQGVGCRFYCRNVASSLGLHGAATNLDNGDVQVLIDVADIAQAEKYAASLKNNQSKFRFYGMITSVDVKKFNGVIDGDYCW